ncbi:MAG: transposase [Spirochaetaceae bacterium]|nr:transposase [Spirochaetaceae bacterium]
MKKYTLEFKKAVVDDFNSERYTVAQIAKKHGVPVGTIYRWVKERDTVGLTESHRGVYVRKVDEGVKHKIVEMYNNKKGITVIGKELGLNPMTVKKWLQRLGIYNGSYDAYRNHRKLSQRDLEEIEGLYLSSNLTVKEIGLKYGVAGGYISCLMSERGLERPKHLVSHSGGNPGKRQGISEHVVRDYNTGLYTHKDIADKYGVSTRTISRILADAGIESDNTVKMATASQVAGVLEDVKEDLSSGVDLYAICEKYNLPLHSVKKIAAGRYDNLRVTRSGEFAVSYYQPVAKKKVEPVVEEPVEVVDESVGKVIELHEKGLKISEMMRELGLTRYAVTRILEDNGLDTKRVRADKPSGTKSDRVRDDVLAAHNDGLGAADIAKRCGVSIPTVRKVLREAGVVPHKHTVHDDAAGCGEGKPLLSAQQQEELNQVVDQVGSKAAEGIVSQEDTGP